MLILHLDVSMRALRLRCRYRVMDSDFVGSIQASSYLVVSAL